MSAHDTAPAPTRAVTPHRLRRVSDAVSGDPAGVLGLLLVGLIGLIGSYLLWPLAAVPAGVVAEVLPAVSCAPAAPRSAGVWTCSLWAGLVRMIGPIAVLVVAYLLRRRLARMMQRASGALPAGLHGLLAPLVATGLFLLVWSGSHIGRDVEPGLIGQRGFPVVVGLSTYSVMRWGPAIQARMTGFLDARDRLPLPVRVVVLVAFTTLVSVVLTWQDRISQGPLKEQLVVIVGLVGAGLLLAPRRDRVGGPDAPVQPPSAAPPSAGAVLPPSVPLSSPGAVPPPGGAP